jgi:flavin reductase (DIM6/NTAB) family NADH-FMN oxidoreductase RutF
MEDDFFLDTPSTPVDPDDLRQAMRYWATGVAVVTSAYQGVVHGMTVSSFTSVSLTPPQVLISLAQNTRTYTLVKSSHLFGVTLLSSEQEGISNRFAGRYDETNNRFAGLETFTLTTGVPLLRGGIAQFDCRVIATFTSGTHTLFIGEVLAAQFEPDSSPLLYFNRSHRKIK